jgi:hypothetical protein
MDDEVPTLSPRSVGWLRYLYRKATTADSWDREDHPHPHWDDRSDAPMLCFPRFDLIDSTYAVALMADRTPAWREVYHRILDELVFRHTGWWAANDWLTQLGPDPKRKDYDAFEQLLLPPHLVGEYDVPGWTANGIEPWGLQMDPIAADGMLFFKGWFLVMLGLHLRATNDASWNRPFDMIRDGEHTFTWTYSGIAEHLTGQWRARPEGCHCENTKIWPLCLTAAGLGLQLHDVLHGTEHHVVFDEWWERKARPDYLGWTDAGPAPMATFYYDPIIDYHHKLPLAVSGALVTYYLAGQRRGDARELFDASLTQLGLDAIDGPIAPPGPRPTGVGLLLAKDWGMTELAAALQASADEHLEPTWDHARGEFTWGLQLGEEHPRGQYNAALAAAEAVTPDAWHRLATTTGGTRFDEPTVVGVDFPAVALTRAWWDGSRLELATAPIREADPGVRTTFRVTNLGDPTRWRAVEGRGGAPVDLRVVGRELEVTVPAGGAPFALTPTRRA